MCPALRGSTVSYAGVAHFPKHSLEYCLNFWSQSKKNTDQTRPDQIFGADTKMPKSSGPVRKNMATDPPPPPNPTSPKSPFLGYFKNVYYTPTSGTTFLRKSAKSKNLPFCIIMTPPPPGVKIPIYINVALRPKQHLSCSPPPNPRILGLWGRLKRSARAMQLFGRLAVLETHALRS